MLQQEVEHHSMMRNNKMDIIIYSDLLLQVPFFFFIHLISFGCLSKLVRCQFTSCRNFRTK